MSDGESFRPRRGWQDPATDPEESTASDDTSAPLGRRARRGAADESGPAEPARAARAAAEEPTEEPTEAISGEPVPVGESTEEEAARNPFARPGSEAADTPIPAPVLPRSAGEFADSPGPAPRRSALSSTTPVSVPEQAPAVHWAQAHRDTLLKWSAAGIALALILAVISFIVVKSLNDPGAEPSPDPTATASVTESVAPATTDDLVTGEDLAAVATSAWTITQTSSSVGEHQGRVACFQTAPQEPNPTTSLQRTLATTDETAALHRIDVFADADVAKQVFADRASILSSCSEVPSYLVGANKVSGLAEETFQITVEFQNDPSQFHTVLLARQGAAVQILDVTKFGSAVDASAPAEALARPQAALNKAQGDTEQQEVKVSATQVPAVEPVGWLSVSDLPRIKAGVGRWTMTGPADVTATGTGCEDLTLASVSGPKTRAQATYLMTQDSAAPATFGVDQMQFTFESDSQAKKFADKLVKSLGGCADRVNTATVKKLDDVETKVGDVEATTRAFEITQATSASEAVGYQLLVTNVGKTVSYTLVSVGDDYKFSGKQLEQLAARVAVRATQAA